MVEIGGLGGGVYVYIYIQEMISYIIGNEWLLLLELPDQWQPNF